MTEENSSSLLQVVRDFLGPAAKELGELAGDHIRYYRWKSAESIVRKAAQWAKEKGIQPNHIPIKFIVPFIEKASLHDANSDMADRWSCLLLNAVEDYKDKYEVYMNILSSISSEEARLLRCAFCKADKHSTFKFEGYTPLKDTYIWDHDWTFDQAVKELEVEGLYFQAFHGRDIPNTNEFSFEGYDIPQLLMHLESLQLVSTDRRTLLDGTERCFFMISRITPLGYDLIETCEKGEEE